MFGPLRWLHCKQADSDTRGATQLHSRPAARLPDTFSCQRLDGTLVNGPFARLLKVISR
jgi:hypothetical protein